MTNANEDLNWSAEKEHIKKENEKQFRTIGRSEKSKSN